MQLLFILFLGTCFECFEQLFASGLSAWRDGLKDFLGGLRERAGGLIGGLAEFFHAQAFGGAGGENCQG